MLNVPRGENLRQLVRLFVDENINERFATSSFNYAQCSSFVSVYNIKVRETT